MSLTAELIALIREKPVAPGDLARAADFVLDTLACAIAGKDSIPGRALLALARQRGDAPHHQAFLWGGLAHIVEMDDLHRPSVVHPGSVVIPAAWALAQAQGVDGPTFLRAVLWGYEACCRVGNSVGKGHYAVWHNTATCGPFGSAMAAALLLDLDVHQTRWALGNAGTQAAGLWQFLPDGAMSKHLHTARGAEAGLTAAQLAGLGFTGPDRILEGPKGFYAGACPDPDPTAVTRAPEAPWQLQLTSMKPYPCCRHTHPAIDAALTLFGRVPSHAIQGIEVATYRAAMDVCDRPRPQNPYHAKFSLQHCVAQALTRGQVGFTSFDAPAREAAAPLAERVALVHSGDAEGRYPEHWSATVGVATAEGVLEAHCHEAAGDPQRPLERTQLLAKVDQVLAFAQLAPDQRTGFIDTVLGLTDPGARVPPLAALALGPE